MADPQPEPAMRPAHHSGKSGAGRFLNPWASARAPGGFLSFLRTRLLDWRSVAVDRQALRERFVRAEGVDWEAVARPPADGALQATWIGHASFLVQLDGLAVLTDPIFSQRCSASQLVGPRRVTDPACQAEELLERLGGAGVDAVVISHNHYDHLDEGSVRALRDRVRLWAVPLGVKRHLVGFGVPEERVTELDWWEEARLGDARFVCTPAQHFSGRTLLDSNATLWSSWAVVGPTTRFFFGGDTGLRSVPRGMTLDEERAAGLPACPAFDEIGRRLGPFDAAFLPVGAYSPRHFMSPIHLSPEDAVCVHTAVRSRRSIGCHCCTFCLTDEPLAEPSERLAAEVQARRLPADAFAMMMIGETRRWANVPADAPWPEPLSFEEARGWKEPPTK